MGTETFGNSISHFCWAFELHFDVALVRKNPIPGSAIFHSLQLQYQWAACNNAWTFKMNKRQTSSFRAGQHNSIKDIVCKHSTWTHCCPDLCSLCSRAGVPSLFYSEAHLFVFVTGRGPTDTPLILANLYSTIINSYSY